MFTTKTTGPSWSLYLLALFQEVFDQDASHSERMRAEFARRKKRFALLHRNGDYYLVSPKSEKLERVEASRLPRFGVYTQEV